MIIIDLCCTQAIFQQFICHWKILKDEGRRVTANKALGHTILMVASASDPFVMSVLDMHQNHLVSCFLLSLLFGLGFFWFWGFFGDDT